MKRQDNLETSGVSNPVSFPGFHPDVHPSTDRTRGFPPTLLNASIALAIGVTMVAYSSIEIKKIAKDQRIADSLFIHGVGAAFMTSGLIKFFQIIGESLDEH